ncbi:MAG: branched-chain-amino-acid transaminase [Planctomycetota bacterium]
MSHATTPSKAASPQVRAAGDDGPMVYVNGQIVPKSEASVNVFDHGLLYGDGVFEGIRVYNGKIFMLGQHMDRLWASAEKLYLDIPISRDEMIDVQRRCIEANGITNGYIRLIVTRGEGTLGLNPYHCPRAGIICIADQIRLYPEAMYEAGMRVVKAHRPRIPVECLDPRIKSLNYLNNIMAKCEAIHLTQSLGITAEEDKLLEVIMTNTDGNVAEGSGDNIFVVKDGAIRTPPVEDGLLEGITRRFVIDRLAPQCGLSVEIAHLSMDDIYAADELFMTGSAAEIIGIREVLEHDGSGGVTASHAISDGEGPVTNSLRMAFRGIVTSSDVPED